MVVHAPSKYGGAVASEGSRGIFAATLRHFIDSLQRVTHKLNLVVMGDFNDTPDSKSVVEGLQASSYLQGKAPDSLYNLAMPYYLQGKGTIKFQGMWELIDLVLVSGNLLNDKEPLYCVPTDYRIFDAPFLLEEDKRYTGLIPRRTYQGMRYHGGISDHLPIILDIRKGY
jgi:endonuclease/exonuclease/phosphatase family metal-dependent hydrolase